MKKIIIAAVLLALIGGGVYYWKTQTVKKEVRYASFDVISKTISEFVETTGSVAPQNRVEINPSAAGRIEKILVQEGDTLKIIKTSNADTPVAHGQTALLTCDVWEHAYYLDYQNRRKDFVEAFIDHLANWEFAASQLK